MKIGLPELIIILVAILLIFGPKNLPKLGSAIGKTVKNVRDGIDGKLDDDEEQAGEEGTKALEASSTEKADGSSN